MTVSMLIYGVQYLLQRLPAVDSQHLFYYLQVYTRFIIYILDTISCDGVIFGNITNCAFV